ncbi:MAG: Transcriptional regulator [Bacteroidetes bacterium]|nr:Transcriptional regulator [Bacteroidota bacterium]
MEDDIYLKKLGELIVKIRSEKGVTQMELSRKINSTNTHLRRIERGETNVTLLTMRHIADALSVSLSELIDVE